MSSRYDIFHADRDVLRIPVIRVAYVLSVLIHAAVLWPWLPSLDRLSPAEVEDKNKGTRLQVRIAPREAPVQAPPPAASTRAAPPSPPRPPASATRVPPAPVQRSAPAPAPPMLAMQAPGPSAAPPPPAPAPIARAPAPPVLDMAAMIEARRQARGNPAPPSAPPAPQPVEDETERRNRIVAENIGQKTQNFGAQPKGSGGIFQIEHIYYDYADFQFYGWNSDIKRNTRQLIEVRKGNNSDIRIAVVRRMIVIIRQYEQEDFRWDSARSGRTLTLSARQRDNADLEQFMMREFFPEFVGSR